MIETVILLITVVLWLLTAERLLAAKRLRRKNAELRASIEKTMWDVSLDHGDTRCVCCFGEYPNHRDKCDLAKLLERTL